MANGPYDVFGASWGLGLPIEWFDEAGIDALIRANANESIDQLVLGWDGEEVDTWAVIRQILRARGFFIGLTAEGLITFARLRLASIVDLIEADTVSPLPHTLRIDPAEGDGVDRIVATVGKTPWFEGDRIEVNLLSDADALQAPNSLRAGIFADRTAIEMDLSVLAEQTTEEAGFSLVALARFRGFGTPRFWCRANDPNTLAHGDIVRIGDPLLKASWFVAADGTEIEVDPTEARWYGQIVGFRRALGDGSIDVEVLLHSWHLNEFPRLRAPSASVVSEDDTAITVGAGDFFGAAGDGSDAAQFTVGDVVELWTQYGTRRSTARIIAAIGAHTLELDTAFDVTPDAFDVIRLAHLDDVDGYPEDGNPAKLAGVLAYTYAANDDGELGPNALAAHIYGMI